MKTLISIDPGQSTGLCVGTYSDTEPFKLTHFFQIEGGVEGFLTSCKTTYSGYSLKFWMPEGDEFLLQGVRVGSENVTFIAEKFTARGGANAGFAYKTRDLEPLRIEGAMLAMGLQPTWVSPAQQYFSGGEGKAKKKQAQHRWLKERDLYVTGKMVGCDNADDVRSAIAHSISFLRRTKHMPTINYYFPETTDE